MSMKGRVHKIWSGLLLSQKLDSEKCPIFSKKKLSSFIMILVYIYSTSNLVQGPFNMIRNDLNNKIKKVVLLLGSNSPPG